MGRGAGRSRSRSRSRERRRSRSRDRSRRSASREREHKRDRGRRSRSRSRDKRRRSRSRSREREGAKGGAAAPAAVPAAAAPVAAADAEAKRLKRLEAARLLAQRNAAAAAATGGAAAPAAPHAPPPSTAGPAQAPAAAPAPAATVPPPDAKPKGLWKPSDEGLDGSDASSDSSSDSDEAADGAADGEVDALDAFMAAEVLPEVTEHLLAEARAKAEARRKRAEELAACAAAGVAPPPLADLAGLSEDEQEEKPFETIEVPTSKVKLIVGAGGETIKWIQKKSKARLQVLKTEDVLNRAFGTEAEVRAQEAAERALKAAASGAVARKKAAFMLEGPSGMHAPLLPEKGSVEAAAAATERAAAAAALAARTSRIELYGSEEACAIAKRMINEVFEKAAEVKRDKHVAQRDKEKERKAENRRLYHLRHMRDYELLGVPLGTKKDDIKKAYRKLAFLWHPDKHAEGPAREEAAKRFVAIQAAYDALMNSDEEAAVQALMQS